MRIFSGKNPSSTRRTFLTEKSEFPRGTTGFTPTPERALLNSRIARGKTARLVWGFTITEIIVVVGILSLLLSIGVGYTQKGGKQIVLYREHAQLTQQILRARGFATQKLRPEEELICGYGLALFPDALNASSYTLFKDLPSGGCPGTGTMESGEELETFVMDESVGISGELNYDEFVFSPRDGFVYLGQQRARPEQEIIIPLELKNADQQLILHVNYIGQVYTE